MFNLFIIFFLLAFAILAWRRIDWAAMLIIAGLPLYLARFKVFGVPATLLEAMILIAFFCWLIFQTRLKDFLRGRYGLKDFLKNSPFARGGSAEGRCSYPFGLEVILLLIVSFIAVGVAGFSAGSLGIWKAYFFEPILLYVLILNLFQDKNGVNKICLSLAIGALAVSAYAVFQKITGIGIDNPLWQAEATRRAVSFFGYPNAVGLYLGPIIPVLTAFLFLPGKKEFSQREEKLIYPLKRENISALGLSKGFLALIILLSLAAIIFAGSEGALVGLAAAFVIGGLLGNKKTRIAVLAFALAGGIVLALNHSDLKAVEQKLTLKDFSGQVRRYQWKETLIMLNHGRFYQGAGLDNYQKAIAPYHQPGFFYDDGTDPLFHQHTVESADYRAKTWRPVEIYMYPHDIFLNFWTELGLAGALLFVWVVIKFVYLTLKNYKLQITNYKFLSLGLLGSMIMIVVHGLVDVPYFKNDLACLFWILVACLAILRRRQKNSPGSR